MVFLGALAAIDLLCAITLVAAAAGFPLPYLQAIGALALVGKGLFFFGDVLSIIDIAAALAMFGLLWFSAPAVAIGVAVYLGIKSFVSFA